MKCSIYTWLENDKNEQKLEKCLPSAKWSNSHLDKSAHSVVDGDKVNISNKTNMAYIFTKYLSQQNFHKTL